MDDAGRVRSLLTLAAEPPGPPVLEPGPDLVRRARRRQREHRELAAVGAVVAILALATPLAALRESGGPALVAEPASVPAPLHAAAPVLRNHGGPFPPQQTACRFADVGGAAEMTGSAYGLLGVVRLHGAQCSLRVDPRSITLLDGAGRPLGVPVRAEPNVNPGATFRPDFAQGSGDVTVGFAWRGSWCGPPAARLRMTVGASPKTAVVVPLAGRSPPCSSDTAAAGYVVPGLVGGTNDAVQTAPPAWAVLRATLELPPTARGDQDIRYRVLIRNTGTVPVALSPCPDFATLISGNVLASAHGAAGYQIIGGYGVPGDTLPCGRVLPAGASLKVPLRFDYEAGPYAPGVVRVEWAMAGVPTASSTVRVR